MTSDVPSGSGLCARCAHARAVSTPRSRFVLCEKSREHAEFPRYPRLPVVACAGFAPRSSPGGDTPQEPDPGPSGK